MTWATFKRLTLSDCPRLQALRGPGLLRKGHMSVQVILQIELGFPAGAGVRDCDDSWHGEIRRLVSEKKVQVGNL